CRVFPAPAPARPPCPPPLPPFPYTTLFRSPFEVDEYTSIGELNRLWTIVEELPDEIRAELSALQSHFDSIEELYEHQEDIICHSDCDDMADVARYYIEEKGDSGEDLENLQNYIDYKYYGSDSENEVTFIYTSYGIF